MILFLSEVGKMQRTKPERIKDDCLNLKWILRREKASIKFRKPIDGDARVFCGQYAGNTGLPVE
jgi:hypothetical protein